MVAPTVNSHLIFFLYNTHTAQMGYCYRIVFFMAFALAATPAHIDAATSCRKCHGAGTVVAWVPCHDCNGNVMSGGTRCKTCVRSVKVGQVREKIPCPVCQKDAAQNRNVGLGDNRVFAAHGESRARRSHVRNQIRAERKAQSVKPDSDISAKQKTHENTP